MSERDHRKTSSDDIDERLDTSKTTGKQIRINIDDEENLTKIPGIGEKTAKLIVHLREGNGHLTKESLQQLIKKQLFREKLENIDFARNDQKSTDKQQKRKGEDDKTLINEAKAMSERDHRKTSSDDIDERLDTSKTTGKQIRINIDDEEYLTKIPGIGEKTAKLIVHLREGNGHLTKESLQQLIKKQLSREELENIDFARNGQKSTDKQQKRIGKDDKTLEHIDDVWDSCLKNDDIEGIWELLKGKTLPSHSTFLKAVDKLSTQTENLKDFCRIVSNNLKEKIPSAKIVYPAINPKNNCITFVVLSTCPSDEKYVGEYPVKMKYAYGRCNEDYSIRIKEMKKGLCFKTAKEEESMNAAMRSAYDMFSKWPNYSRLSFSFYKSSRFNENDSSLNPIEKGCIVLFVYLKHWKPVGWDFFPDHFREYEIDVRQSLCARKHTLSMPSEIAMNPGGTIQGRISKQGVNDKSFAVTAAHVALNDKEVTKFRTELEVYEGDRLNEHLLPFGISRQDMPSVPVIKAALGGHKHVDVALVELSEHLQKRYIPFDCDDLGMLNIFISREAYRTQ